MYIYLRRRNYLRVRISIQASVIWKGRTEENGVFLQMAMINFCLAYLQADPTLVWLVKLVLNFRQLIWISYKCK